MGRRPYLVALLVALLLPFTSTAEEAEFDQAFALEWTYDFGDAYITTAPLFVQDRLFVRTSASWGGSEVPTIASFSLTGEELWRYAHPNSTNHDMAPLLHVAAGQGDCGTWPSMLIIGWSDGAIEAREVEDGALLWTHQTEPITWGITGSLAFENDRVTAPTRSGLVSLCAADGSLMLEATTGLGWRNGITTVEGVHFLGDESGVLWSVAADGTSRSVDLGDGSIRHAPIATPAGLFVQLQQDGFSTIHVVNTSGMNSTQTLSIGPSPAIPIVFNDLIVTSDSNAIRSLRCVTVCELLDSSPFRSNGEIGAVYDGHIMLPYNGIEQAWGLVSIDSNGVLDVERFSTGADGYATSGPGYLNASFGKMLAFGSDEGIMFVYSSPPEEATSTSTSDGPRFDWLSQGTVFLLYVSLGAAGVQFLRGHGASMIKFLSLYALLIGLLVINEVSVEWAKTVDQLTPDTPNEVNWDPSWNESWEGTQVVSITIGGEERVLGGFEGYTNAFDLTVAASNALGIEMASESTGIGAYVVSFDGQKGDGWEYTVDGTTATLASDFSTLDSGSIVRWSPVEAR
jgi:hypothetical protein